MQLAVFIVLGLVTVGAALMVVTTQNLLRSALWLILTFVGIAGIFVLLEAEFIAVAQILIYVGAISTLIIFAVMLTRNVMDPESSQVQHAMGCRRRSCHAAVGDLECRCDSHPLAHCCASLRRGTRSYSSVWNSSAHT